MQEVGEGVKREGLKGYLQKLARKCRLCRNCRGNATFAEIDEEMQDLQNLVRKCNFCRIWDRNAEVAEGLKDDKPLMVYHPLSPLQLLHFCPKFCKSCISSPNSANLAFPHRFLQKLHFLGNFCKVCISSPISANIPLSPPSLRPLPLLA